MCGLEWKTLAVADLMAIVDYISDDDPKAAYFAPSAGASGREAA